MPLRPRDFLPGNPFEGEPPVPRFIYLQVQDVDTPVQEVPAPAKQKPAVVARPGCTVADNLGLTEFYLDRLSRGFGGYGVLRVARERLLEAQDAALVINRPDVAQKVQALADKLPAVSTEAEARQILAEASGLADECWDLGRRCKGLSREDLERAMALAKQVRDGVLSQEQAAAILTGGQGRH